MASSESTTMLRGRKISEESEVPPIHEILGHDAVGDATENEFYESDMCFHQEGWCSICPSLITSQPHEPVELM